jgi:hypothetical protein
MEEKRSDIIKCLELIYLKKYDECKSYLLGLKETEEIYFMLAEVSQKVDSSTLDEIISYYDRCTISRKNEYVFSYAMFNFRIGNNELANELLTSVKKDKFLLNLDAIKEIYLCYDCILEDFTPIHPMFLEKLLDHLSKALSTNKEFLLNKFLSLNKRVTSE